MDSIVVLMMLMFGQGAKVAFTEMQLANQQTIQSSKEIRSEIEQITAWIKSHREHEATMISKVEEFKRKLDLSRQREATK
jgi:hypothetical protein